MLIVIPAYNPDYHLLDVLKSLKKTIKNKVIVVNDGSDESCNEIFIKASEYALILKHDVNKGKGAAMKTALSYIKDNMNDVDGVIFVDADGQHKAHDVKRLIEVFNENSDSLIIGCRVFDNDIPIRSKIGNKITRFIFKSFTGKYVSDTQTGLRAISTKYIPILLKIDGDRYEYEMNMLVDIVKNKINIKEVPIDTIYEDKKNSTSHFKVFRDSFLIYKVFLEFVLSSLICGLVDYVAFLLFTLLLGKVGIMIVLANIFARFISATINYTINKNVVFKSKNKSLIKYILLAIFIILTNSLILYILTNILHISPAISKIIVEALLFIVSYNVQQKIIFKK